MSRTLRTALLAALLLGLAACTRGCSRGLLRAYTDVDRAAFTVESFFPEPAPAAKPKRVREQYVAVTAKRRAQDARAFVRIPLDLWAPFEVAVRFGVFREDRAAGLDGGLFGVELDARGPEPLEFYGLYAQYVNGGLNVFVSKRGPGDAGATNIGQRFFPATLRVDATLAHDGANLVFSARPAGATEAPVVVATLPFAQNAPLNPGIGAFQIDDRAQVGFSRLRLVANGAPPAPVPADEAAIAALFRAAAPIVEARDLLESEAPDTAAALALLDQAAPLLDAAKAALESLPDAPKGRASPLEFAVARMELAVIALATARNLLGERPDRPAKVLALLDCRVLVHLVLVLDAALPFVLRDSLPLN